MSRFFSQTAAALFIFFSLYSQLAFTKPSEAMAIIGDAGRSGSQLENLKRSIQRENVTSLILPGDNLYKGTYSSIWDSWKNEGFRFDVVAIGNHTAGYKKELQYFSMPAEYYSVVKNGARFIVLNSDNENTVTAQQLWLINELNRAPEKLIFLVYHHPTFTISTSHSWTEKEEFQVGMRELLKIYRSKITALFLGHDHMSSYLNFGDIPVIVAGAGRDVRNESPVSFSEDGFRIQTRYIAPQTQHWALLEIDEKAETATVHFVRVNDQQRVFSVHLNR